MEAQQQSSNPPKSVIDAVVDSHSSKNESPPPFIKRFLPHIILCIILFIGVIIIAGWYSQTQRQESNTVVIQPTTSTMDTQKLIVGTDPTLPPMEYTENGNLLGYDIDLANFIAGELGTRVEFKNIVFDNLFTALEQNQIDIIISAVTITKEREQKYDFSEQYLNAGQVIITKRDNDLIKSTADLKNKKISVQKGTTNEEEAVKYTSDNLVIRYPDFVQATNALVNGTVDAVFTDLPSAKGIVVANPTLKISSDPFTNEFYGIVFRKGDPRVQQINKALTSLRVNGILSELKHKWLD